jgi:sorting and assembly machinery component 37
MRAAAKLRTDHLGLSGLDIDTENGLRKEHSIIPESLRTSRTTVSSLLAASPEAHAQIRLDALARNFLQPLQDLLGDKRYLVSDSQLSSLDCLALGYLSLMLLPELPQPWLSKTIRTNFPRLAAWTQDSRARVFGPAVTVDDALLTNDGNASTRGEKLHESFLPWVAPKNGGIIGVGGAYLATLADSIPIVGQYRRGTRELQLGKDSAHEHSSAWQAVAVAGGAIASVGLLVGYLFHHGVISLGYESASEKSGLDAFGEAGSAFSTYMNEMDAQARQNELLDDEWDDPHDQPLLELGIDLNRIAGK